MHCAQLLKAEAMLVLLMLLTPRSFSHMIKPKQEPALDPKPHPSQRLCQLDAA